MKAGAIKQIISTCLFYSACTKAASSQSSTGQSENENLAFTNEQMKENALEQIGNLDGFLFHIFQTSSFIDFNLCNKMDGKSLKSIDQLKKLLEKLKSFREVIDPYLSRSECFRIEDKVTNPNSKHKDEKDSKLLGLIKAIPDELDALETTFDSWHEVLKEEFLQFIEKSNLLHESSIEEMEPQSKKLPPSVISESMPSEEFKEYIFQLIYYSKIIDFLDFYFTKFFKRKDDKKIKEYKSYIKIVLMPLINPIYEYYQNNSTGTCPRIYDF